MSCIVVLYIKIKIVVQVLNLFQLSYQFRLQFNHYYNVKHWSFFNLEPWTSSMTEIRLLMLSRKKCPTIQICFRPNKKNLFSTLVNMPLHQTYRSLTWEQLTLFFCKSGTVPGGKKGNEGFVHTERWCLFSPSYEISYQTTKAGGSNLL